MILFIYPIECFFKRHKLISTMIDIEFRCEINNEEVRGLMISKIVSIIERAKELKGFLFPFKPKTEKLSDGIIVSCTIVLWNKKSVEELWTHIMSII